MARFPFLNADGTFQSAQVKTQLDARTDARMRGQLPTLAEELGIGGSGSGIEEVSGTVTLDPAKGALREVYATAAVTVQGERLAGGEMALFRYFNGAWQVIAFDDAGLPRDRAWRTVGATTPTDSTPPVGASLTVTGSGQTRTLAVSGATDAGTGLNATPYSFSIDGGTSWTPWQSGASWTSGTLTPGTKTPMARVRDAAQPPNVATVSAAAVVIEAPKTPLVDTFDRFTAAGTALVGTKTSDGSATWASDLPMVLNQASPSLASTASGSIALAAAEQAAVVPIAYPRAKVSVAFTDASAAFRVGIGASTSSRVVAQHFIESGAHKWALIVGGAVIEAAADPSNRATGVFTLALDGSSVTFMLDGVAFYQKTITPPGTTPTHAGIARLGASAGTGTLDDFKVEYL